MSESEFIISFENPWVPENVWNGSMNFDPVEGGRVHAITEYDDPQIDLRDPLAVYALDELLLNTNVTDRMILTDMDYEGSAINFKHGTNTLTERFNAKIVVSVSDPNLVTLDSTVNRFTIRSPIVFSFIDHHAYQVSITKRNRRFTVRDRPFKQIKFNGQVFSKIEFDIERSISNASSGNVGKIEYSAAATFTPNKAMSLFEVIRCAQLFEKLLFILVGDHCGPMEVDINGGRKKPPRAIIKFASPLYSADDVITGIWRCWTLEKVEIDVAKLIDMAFARYDQVKVPIELIIDAHSQKSTQDKFFRLVRVGTH